MKSEYRLGDYGAIMKGDKYFCQYNEPYSLIDELNKLEDKLEAKEKEIERLTGLIKEAYDEGYSFPDMYKTETDSWSSSHTKTKLDQLKGQDDET